MQTRRVLRQKLLPQYRERVETCIPDSLPRYRTVGGLLHSHNRSLRRSPLHDPPGTSPAIANLVRARSYIPYKHDVGLNYMLPNEAGFTCVFPCLISLLDLHIIETYRVADLLAAVYKLLKSGR